MIERPEGVTGTLFIVLYGYKLLGISDCPEHVARHFTGPRQCPVETIGQPSDRIIPFDYVVTVPLTGRPKNLVEMKQPSARKAALWRLPWVTPCSSTRRMSRCPTSPPASRCRPRFLSVYFPRTPCSTASGFRPNLVRLAFDNNAQLNTQLPPRPQRAFRTPQPPRGRVVPLHNPGHRTRRGLQNQPLHNIAGLGIANGDRPFKRLARPMIFCRARPSAFRWKSASPRHALLRLSGLQNPSPIHRWRWRMNGHSPTANGHGFGQSSTSVERRHPHGAF